MQLTQVRYFIEAARLLNFTRAAELCNVTQPALTKAIKSLEDELGGALFHRSPKLCLTDLGRRVLPFIEQTYEAASAVRQQARSYRTGEIVPIGIGIDSSVPSALIRPFLSELCRVYSGLAIHLTSGLPDALLNQMIDGEVDILLRAHDGSIDHQLIHHLPLKTERYLVICAPGHEFATAQQVTLDEMLRAQDRISFCGTADRLIGMLGDMSQPRHHVTDADQLEALLDAQLGWCLVPEGHPLVARHTTLPMPGIGIERIVELVYPAGRQHGAAVSALVRLAKMGLRSDSATAA